MNLPETPVRGTGPSMVNLHTRAISMIVDEQANKREQVTYFELWTHKLPNEVLFRKEKGNVLTQKVTYDWRPSIYAHCKKYGHESDSCQRLKKPEVVASVPPAPKDSNEVATIEMTVPVAVENVSEDTHEPVIDKNNGFQQQKVKQT
ncbi:hypothetical protein RND71_015754 [Anisodus tanguticus]|uniref:Zinc knuckle CX2CX4HX4C domain-containing protein n=1 Tax=Anisodus tanguticus TaxID=243964 RepID=A0AAE1S6T9_9SOLA|nr:hypothetical protein RND71_015754 [Anisodus tanguticus]